VGGRWERFDTTGTVGGIESVYYDVIVHHFVLYILICISSQYTSYIYILYNICMCNIKIYFIIAYQLVIVVVPRYMHVHNQTIMYTKS